MAVDAFSLPFREQSEFFRRKLNMPTDGWVDIYAREHDYAFMVAGANRDDLVEDFRQAVQKVIDEGGTLADFRKDFDRIVQTHGWDYNGGRNWRSRIIYETNLRSSYMAGRYEQLMAGREDRPYWQYLHNDAVEHPRPLHESWNGLVLHWSDDWWLTHFPINAWGCQCAVHGLSEDDLARMGKSGPDTAPNDGEVEHVIGKNSPGGPRTLTLPAGIDPGFEHIPGKARLESQIPTPREIDADIPAPTPGLPNTVPVDPLPDPREFPLSRILPDGLSDEDYASRYLAEFGATLDSPTIVEDVIGERLVVGKDLFVDKQSGGLKANKRDRGKWLMMLADALKSPDEVWVRMEWLQALKRAVVRRRYIARYNVAGESRPAVAVFEVGDDGWMGVTTFPPEDGVYTEALRQGVRLYKRDE